MLRSRELKTRVKELLLGFQTAVCLCALGDSLTSLVLALSLSPAISGLCFDFLP